jgi:hypothetical protein
MLMIVKVVLQDGQHSLMEFGVCPIQVQAYVPFKYNLRVQLIRHFILLASNLKHSQPFFLFQGFGEEDSGITTCSVASSVHSSIAANLGWC